MLELWGMIGLALFLVSFLPQTISWTIYALIALRLSHKPSLTMSRFLWQLRKQITLREGSRLLALWVRCGWFFLLAAFSLALFRFGTYAWPLDSHLLRPLS